MPNNLVDAPALECIDLNDPVHSKPKMLIAPDTPLKTERSEFSEPDKDGLCAKNKILINEPLDSAIKKVSSIGQQLGLLKSDGLFNRKKLKKTSTNRSNSQDTLSLSMSSSTWNGEPPHAHGEDDCKICLHRKRTSCLTVVALLALDIFTLCLIIIAFNQMHDRPRGKDM